MVSDNIRIDITPEIPHVDVVMNYSGTSVLDVEETPSDEGSISVYPNPVFEKLTVSINLEDVSEIEIAVYSISGQLVYRIEEMNLHGNNSFTIPFENYSNGLYTIRISSNDGINIIKKVIKSN